jgi:SAM-dependent methyltransferase
MSSLEHKAVDAILNRIRARRKAAPAAGNRTVARPSAGTERAKLRDATLSDFEAITDLKKRGGIVLDPIENWERLWIHNPALQIMKGVPIGWVLESGDGIVGYLGNIALLYRYGGKVLTAVTGSGFVVDPEYRAMSLSLDSAFYRQKGIDLLLATTAIEAVGKLARAFKSDPIPQPDFDAVLFWVLQPYPFARSVVRKLELKEPFSGIGSVLASLAMQSDKLLRRRWTAQSPREWEISEIGVNEIGDEFQVFWEGILKESSRLYADRSAESLRWHFTIPGHKGITQVLCCHKNGRLAGYAVIRHEVEREDGLRRSLIADLLAREDDPATLRALFTTAYEQARRAGSHVLEVIGFSANVRQVLGEFKPYVRRYPACPFYYRTNDSNLHRELSDAEAWYACAFDGDGTLMP